MKQKLLDVVIPIVGADIDTFKNSLPFIKRYLPVKNIILIGAYDVEEKVADLKGVTYVNEDELVPGLNLPSIKKIKKYISGTERRSGWYFQQFLKMGYARICKDDYYLIWDADTIPIKNIDFFDESGKPYLDYREYVKYDECFFRTQDLLFPDKYLHKQLKDSFICEHLLVNVTIMNELLDDLAANGAAGNDTFFENVMYVIPKDIINLSGFSEFETYAAYVLKKHGDTHTLRYWRNLRNAGIYIGRNTTEENVNWLSQMFDVISVEDFNPQWFVCKVFLAIDKKHRIPFRIVYGIVQAMYKVIYDLRFKVRNILKK